MLLFYPGTTKQGIIAGVLIGTIASVLWIAVCPEMYKTLYNADSKNALVPFSQPGIITIPLSFLAIYLVSKFTRSSQAIQTQ
jgi:cation/acetate symporter